MTCSYASEYFVGVNGNDSNSGIFPAKALATLKKASTLMKPGDTMTILPGKYHQELNWTFDGGNKTTIIRAQIPGTVVLHGDIPAPAFKAVPALDGIWVAKYNRNIQGVIERDTQKKYILVPTIEEVRFLSGSWYQDTKDKSIYINTTDFASPSTHLLTLSILKGDALKIAPSSKGKMVRNLNISGLAMTGYNCVKMSKQIKRFDRNFGGIFITRPNNCTISNCVVYLCGGGIALQGPRKSHIEKCVAYGNGSSLNSSGGNIVIYSPAVDCSITNCFAFGSEYSGIRYYGSTPTENCSVTNCVAIDNTYGDIWVKYPSNTTPVKRCFASNKIVAHRIENTIFKGGETQDIQPEQRNIKGYSMSVVDREFADSTKNDFRLQGDSKFRSPKGTDNDLGWGFDANVVYVSKFGNDNMDGKSVRTALRTFDAALKKIYTGGTIYILPGTYYNKITVSGRKQLIIRGRGNIAPVLQGKLIIRSSSRITVESLSLMGELKLENASQITLKNCGISRVARFEGVGLRLLNNAFAANVELLSSGAFVRGNIFAGSYLGKKTIFSGFNSFAKAIPPKEICSFAATPKFSNAAKGIFTVENSKYFDGRNWDGFPVGTYHRGAVLSETNVSHPVPSVVTATTANFRYKSITPCKLQILLNGTYIKETHEVAQFHAPSLFGLMPAKTYKYQFKLDFVAPVYYTSGIVDSKIKHKAITREATFTTLDHDKPGNIYHVALTGNDSKSGKSLLDAWRTINHAASIAKAGDTVLIHSGHYIEHVRVNNTGDIRHPLIFAAAPGAKVWLDGDNRKLKTGFEINGKSHIIIDGLHFRGFNCEFDCSPPSGGVVVTNSLNLTLTRCFYDGRGHNYGAFFIVAFKTNNIIMKNCVIYHAFIGFRFSGCANLEVSNCVFAQNQVLHGYASAPLGSQMYFHNNIFTDNDLQKALNPMIIINDVSTWRESKNCFITRLGESHKPIFGVDRNNGKLEPILSMEAAVVGNWQRARHARQQLTYAAYCKRYKRKAESIFANPQMNMLQDFVTFCNLQEWMQLGVYKKFSNKQIVAKRRDNSRRYNNYELNRQSNGNYKELDFADFFTNNLKLIKCGIGLQPKCFGLKIE